MKLISLFIAWVFSGLGFSLFILPFVSRALFYLPPAGNFSLDRGTYIWLINGPAPFDQFGGGPFWLGYSLLSFLAGAIFTFLGVVVRHYARREK